MTSTTIMSPLQYEPADLMRIIESDPSSFTDGRRNNDIVNWYLARRMLELQSARPDNRVLWQKKEDCISDFKRIPLSADQQYDLATWGETVSDKLWALNNHYDNITNVHILASLWLPMDYQVVPSMSADQLELVTSTEEGK